MAETEDVSTGRVETGTGETSRSVTDRASDAVGSRIGAYLVDFVLLSVLSFGLFVVTMLVAGVLGAVMSGPGAASEGSMAALSAVGAIALFLMWVVIGVMVFGYFTYLDASNGTLGKRFLDLSVVTEDGSPATKRDTAIRTAVLMVPFPVMALLGTILGGVGFFIGLFLMAGWLLVEAAVMVISDDGRRLGDRAAGTYVVGD